MKGCATNLVRHEEVVIYQSLVNPDERTAEVRVTYREPIILLRQEIEEGLDGS